MDTVKSKDQTSITLFENGQQTTWDATSLGTLTHCAEKYRMRYVEGWTTEAASMDVVFGHLYGLGLETFYRDITEKGMTHDAAVRDGVRAILCASWNSSEGKPETGAYVAVWHCTGTEKFKNSKGNAAKCPWSHKGKFFPAPGPVVCGECGSATETTEIWSPKHAVKDRIQAVKAFVWYTEENKTSPLQIVSLDYAPDGSPAHVACVELGWRLPFVEIDGVTHHLCGWFDTVKYVRGIEGETYVCDYKSTKNTLDNQYFAQYSPNHQVDLYGWAAARVLPPVLGVAGVAIEAMQILKGGIRFGFRIFPSSVEKTQEYLNEIGYWIGRAVEFKRSGYYPKNRSACYMCEFKRVCSAEPLAREHILKEHYIRRWWNPLERKQQDTRP